MRADLARVQRNDKSVQRTGEPVAGRWQLVDSHRKRELMEKWMAWESRALYFHLLSLEDKYCCRKLQANYTIGRVRTLLFMSIGCFNLGGTIAPVRDASVVVYHNPKNG